MIKSPFDSLGKPRLPDWEEVDGAFSCSEIGCPSTVHTARYFEESGLLTWKCEEDHINKIEGFNIG